MLAPFAEEPTLSNFGILTNDEAEYCPTAAREGPAPYAGRLEPDQQGNQQTDCELRTGRHAQQNEGGGDQPVADNINPKASHNRCISNHSGANRKAQHMEAVAARTRSARRRSLFHLGDAAVNERCKWALPVFLLKLEQRPCLYPPSEPLVDGTSSFARGSMATAARNARARPLKQDSAM